VWSCLLAAAVAVAPPAVLPPPAQPAALPAGAALAQMPGNNVGTAALPAASTDSILEAAPHLRGQPPAAPPRAFMTETSDGSILDSLRSTPPTDAIIREPQFVHQQGSQETAPTTDWVKSLGALMLAAVAGALSGGLLWRKRVQLVQSKELATEMASSNQPKLAVAAFGSAAIAGGATAAPGQRKKSESGRTSMQYTTQTILPSLQWCKTGFKGSDLQNGELRTVCLAGCDICVGKTESGQLFAVGDKSPPTGLSFGVGGEVKGDKILEAQYGNLFDVKTGQPVGDWCPSPPIIGPLVGAFMGERQAVAVFEVQQSFFGGEVEVLCDTNAKKAYEADYWKGILDAQGKDDGSYY